MCSHYPSIEVFSALLPYVPETHETKMIGKLGAFRHIILRMYYLIRSIILLVQPTLGQFFLNREEKKGFKALSQADLIVSKGGHIFYSLGDNLGSLLGLYQHSFPLLLAIRCGKPYAFYAQSVGPFQGKWGRKFLKWLFSRATAVTVREQISKQALVDLGVPAHKIQVVPDAAFALTASTDREVLQILKQIGLQDGRFVAITVRQWFFGNDPGKRQLYSRYLSAIAELIDHIVTRRQLKVVLIPQVIGPTQAENDLVAMEAVGRLIKNKEGVRLLKIDLSPPQMMALYGKAYAFIGTRFHSVIFALLMGVPAIAISYFGPKSQGIMEMMGLGDYVLDIGEIEPEDLIQKFESLLLNHGTLKKHIQEKISKLHKDSLGTPKTLLSAMQEW